jgi:hypothetical protein
MLPCGNTFSTLGSWYWNASGVQDRRAGQNDRRGAAGLEIDVPAEL